MKEYKPKRYYARKIIKEHAVENSLYRFEGTSNTAKVPDKTWNNCKFVKQTKFDVSYVRNIINTE